MNDPLRSLLPDRELPSDRRRTLQEFLMREVRETQSSPRPTRSRLVRLAPALAAGLAAAVAIGVVAVGGAGTGEQPGIQQPALSRVAQTFELAAVYAAAQPFTPPRSDQWIYIKSRNLSPSAIAADKGQNPDETRELWLKADGTQMAEFNPNIGRLDTWNQDNHYPALAALPTDPAALLAKLRAEITAPPADANAPRFEVGDVDVALFRRIASILDQNLLPPAVTAALWRAAALVPGVSQADELVQIDGRTVVAVGRVQEGWQFEQLLLDPDTHEYVGYRSVATQDHTYSDTPNGPVTEKAGTIQFALTRVKASIVDAAGQQP
jgi:hypothetical protein